MNVHELRSALEGAPRPVLLHVLPEEVFAAWRIPGSLNACVYEMVFAQRVGELIPDKTTRVVVYGSGANSREAAVAAEVLRGQGYRNVEEFGEGFEGWSAAGLPLEGSGVITTGNGPADGNYALNVAESVIRWTGRNLFNHHSGMIRFASGNLVVSRGKLVSASFTADMRTIACEDLTDGAMNRLLLQHLSHSDFFDTEKHPLAEFAASKATPIPGASEGRPNFLLAGELAIRDVSRPVEFPAVVADAGEGRLTGQALLDIDRTEFGSIYGSGKFFRFLGKHVVNDVVHLHIKIHADLGNG